MTSKILTYSKLGVVDLPGEYGGRVWLTGHNNCPYCNSRMIDRDTEHESDVLRRGTFFRIAVCNICGWWLIVEDADQCNNGLAVAYGGILESFNVNSADIPIEVLIAELPKQVNSIYNIDPKKMEDLVAAILSGVHDCDVHQLGYSKDGGIDLILLNSDSPIAIQVKRREKPNRKEGVKIIHEFLGAAILSDHRDLMFVTNADDFTSGAKKAAAKAVKKQIVERFELLSRDKLISLIGLADFDTNWSIALRNAQEKYYGSNPTIPNPYTIPYTMCG